MKQCPSCGLTTESNEMTCPVCGTRMPLNLKVSELTWRKIALAVLIPVLVYLAMTSLLR
jgi:tRNA(Ile2) C34 agmatinyltransferase TiaS